MSPTPDSTLADPQQKIADLRRKLTEAEAERDQALAQQTASAEVLEVINSSPGDLKPVFDAMLERALVLCDAAFGALMSYDGEIFRQAAQRNFPPELATLGGEARALEGSPLHRLIEGENLVAVDDIAASSRPSSLGGRAALVAAGARSMLWVALRRENALVGAITIYRGDVRPFSDKQIILLQSFAAQAVIAMENARLITETREALDQQTATAEVLQVINSSPGDLAPVFDAMLERANTLCGTAHGLLLLLDGEVFRPVAIRGEPLFVEGWLQLGSTPVVAGGVTGRLIRGERTVHLADASTDAAYRDAPAIRGLLEVGGVRTMVGVPLRKDNALLVDCNE